MSTRSNLVLATTMFLTLAGASSGPRAEVSAELNTTGNYVRTVVLSNSSTKKVRIWTVTRSRPSYVALNPDGDLNGDLWPRIEEDWRLDGLPWVAWSRFNGNDFDLAWVRFQNGAWSPIRWVEQVTQPGDDLDPDLAFDANGRPHLVWWRHDSSGGCVYLSIFLSSRWMVPYAVSDVGVDSVNPTVTVLPDFRIQVEYDTPDGHVTRIIKFSRPTTITDDITPFNPTLTEEYTTTIR